MLILLERNINAKNKETRKLMIVKETAILKRSKIID